jgi:hypothetical protein
MKTLIWLALIIGAVWFIHRSNEDAKKGDTSPDRVAASAETSPPGDSAKEASPVDTKPSEPTFDQMPLAFQEQDIRQLEVVNRILAEENDPITNAYYNILYPLIEPTTTKCMTGVETTLINGGIKIPERLIREATEDCSGVAYSYIGRDRWTAQVANDHLYFWASLAMQTICKARPTACYK